MSDSKLIEKTLSSDRIFQGRFLKVLRDQVQLSDGTVSHREYIQHPGAAAVLPILNSGEILMIRQYRHAVKKVFWEIPAGKRDSGEEPLLTARREVQEETGYQVSNLELLTVIHPVIGYSDEEIFLYKGTGLVPGPQKLDHGELIEIATFSSEQLQKMVKNGEITDVKTLISLFWYWFF